MLNAPAVSPPVTADDDPRVGHILSRDVQEPDEARVVLVGFPSDEGVRINGGRPGAAEAPLRIRELLYAMTPDPNRHEAFVRVLAETVDLGDVEVTGDVERDQERLGEVVAPHLEREAVVVVLGGGHETTYGHFLGYVGAGRSARLINWDAHLDVRPRIDGRPHSGSSFRLALEHPSGACDGYTAVGLLPYSTARSHVEYVESRGGHVISRQELTRGRIGDLYDVPHGECLVSFDLDAVDQADAPGVSAPAAGGLPVDTWLHAVYRAGHSAMVRSIDVVELNPRVDVAASTTRLAALTVWYFLRGLAERMG